MARGTATIPGETPTKTTTRRRSRAKPKPPRERIVVISELRGLGGLVLEQALLDATATPQPSLVAWARRLATELDVLGPQTPTTNRMLMKEIVAIHRRAEADPERPTVAVSAQPA